MTEEKITKLNKFMFAIAFVLSCLTMNSDNLKGYFGGGRMSLIMLKFVMIFSVLFILTILNRKNQQFISKTVKATLWVITPVMIFDYYVTNISGSIFLYKVWWIAYIIIASASVFFTQTLIRPKGYKDFYYSFWQGFTPVYLFTLYISFLRNPYSGLTTNFKLGNGTFLMLKAIIRNPRIDFEPYLLFVGNVIIFLPLPFILSALFKKIKPYQLALIGFAAPFIVEGYQYIFKCGDVDIDDVVLNWAGFFIGMLLQQIIKKRLITGRD